MFAQDDPAYQSPSRALNTWFGGGKWGWNQEVEQKKRRRLCTSILSRPGHLGCNGIEKGEDKKIKTATLVYPIPFRSFPCLRFPSIPFAYPHRRSHTHTHISFFPCAPSGRQRERREKEERKTGGKKGQSVYLHTTTTTLYNLLQMPNQNEQKPTFEQLLSVCLSVSNG